MKFAIPTKNKFAALALCGSDSASSDSQPGPVVGSDPIPVPIADPPTGTRRFREDPDPQPSVSDSSHSRRRGGKVRDVKRRGGREGRTGRKSAQRKRAYERENALAKDQTDQTDQIDQIEQTEQPEQPEQMRNALIEHANLHAAAVQKRHMEYVRRINERHEFGRAFVSYYEEQQRRLNALAAYGQRIEAEHAARIAESYAAFLDECTKSISPTAYATYSGMTVPTGILVGPGIMSTLIDAGFGYYAGYLGAGPHWDRYISLMRHVFANAGGQSDYDGLLKWMFSMVEHTFAFCFPADAAALNGDCTQQTRSEIISDISNMMRVE